MDYTLNKQVEVLNSNVNYKRKALADHLKKSQQRKNQYNIVRGSNITKGQVIQPSSGTTFKTELKSAAKDFDKFATSTLNNSDDIGIQTTIMLYEGVKTTVVGSKKLIAVSNSIANGSIKVAKDGIKIAGETYGVATTLYAGYMTGTLKGTIDMYKALAFRKVANAIRYSKPVVSVVSAVDGTKKIYLKASYRLSRNFTLVKGIANGSIKITPKVARRNVAKGIDRFAKSGMTRRLAGGGTDLVKGLSSNSDDTGTQAIGMTVDISKYTVKYLKMNGRAIVKTGKAAGKVTTVAGKGIYRTARGTYRFAKDAKKYGAKKASKIWYNAHLRGAGKKLSEKASEFIVKTLRSLLTSPVFLAAVGLLVCAVVVINTVTVGATATVGGIMDFVQELVEGLEEVAKTVKETIKGWFDNAVGWLKKLFGGKSNNNNANNDIQVDVDIGDDLSLCDYLMGTVQLYKAEFNIKMDKRKEELKKKGYHDIIFYNYDGTINDSNDTNKGLMADKDYVKAELPVWKALMLGTVGTNFTGKQANKISKECFNALTNKKEIPYVDLNGDGMADYNYCDGTYSMNEGQNKVIVKIGGYYNYNLPLNGTNKCYNLSEPQYHSSHNTEGIDCCETAYTCGGHNGKCFYGYDSYKGTCNDYTEHYYCKGHEDKGECTFKAEYSTLDDPALIACGNYTYTTDVDPEGYIIYYCECLGHNVIKCEFKIEYSTLDDPDLIACGNYDYTTAEDPDDGSTIYFCECSGHKKDTNIVYCQNAENNPMHETPNKCDNSYIRYECNGNHPGTTKCFSGSSPVSKGCSNEKVTFTCKGYSLCKGHKLMKVYLGSDGFNTLLNAKFLNRINELKAKDNLTQEESAELSRLQMYYDYAMNCWKNSDPVVDEWYENAS